MGIPLVAGVALAVVAILAAFIFTDWLGLVVLVIVLIVALGISYRVITASDVED